MVFHQKFQCKCKHIMHSHTVTHTLSHTHTFSFLLSLIHYTHTQNAQSHTQSHTYRMHTHTHTHFLINKTETEEVTVWKNYSMLSVYLSDDDILKHDTMTLLQSTHLMTIAWIWTVISFKVYPVIMGVKWHVFSERLRKQTNKTIESNTCWRLI